MISLLNVIGVFECRNTGRCYASFLNGGTLDILRHDDIHDTSTKCCDQKQIISVGLHSKQIDLKACENYRTAEFSNEVLFEASLFKSEQKVNKRTVCNSKNIIAY